MLARSQLSLASSLTLDDSSFWYASQQSCPPSPYQPARLALALGLVTPALLLESHTFGSRTCPQRQCKRCAQCVRTCTVCSPVYANRHPTSKAVGIGRTFGSKKFAAYSTGPPPRMSSDAFRRKRL